MRAVWCALVLVLAVCVLACGGAGSTTSENKTGSGKPSAQLTLKEARDLIVASPGNKGMKRDEVKALFGPPDETREGLFGPNKFFADVWIYRKQKVVWDMAAEKYYPLIRITFVRNVDQSAEELRID